MIAASITMAMESLQRQARRLKFYVLLNTLALLVGLWVSRDEPSVYLGVGVLINLSISAWLISLVRSLNRAARTRPE
jgi:hypothetical protein